MAQIATNPVPTSARLRAPGIYDPIALQLTPGLHRILQAGFVLGLVGAPQPGAAASGTGRLEPAGRRRNDLPLRSADFGVPAAGRRRHRRHPLAGEWWVGHGGHVELVKYPDSVDPT
jgi:hypothetical protein